MTRKRDEFEVNNQTDNAAFSKVMDARISRRSLFKMGGIGMTAGLFSLFPTQLLAGTSDQSANTKAVVSAAKAGQVTFKPVAYSSLDTVIVPDGYVADAFYSWGDPVGIAGNVPAFKKDGSNSAQDQAVQAGMNHDGIAYFPIGDFEEGSRHGLLAMNHEYVDNGLLFNDGVENWSKEKVLKSQNAMGVSVIEVMKNDSGQWEVVLPSKYARRITPHTEMTVSGPAKGHEGFKTEADPSGSLILGTMQNCANGETPWGTYLTCEENWADIFVKAEGAHTDLEKRYGISQEDRAYRWVEFDDRFNVDKHPNEPNRFGWVVEIDPENPESTPIKHTSLGRFKHEGAKLVVGPDKRVAVYMGDDQRFEYIYKFVSRDKYDPAKGKQNSELLNEGTLYVARFDESGAGTWLPLIYGQGGLMPDNGFENQGDVVINARGAADIVGATKMDRPEWITADPKNPGSIYCTLTNNSHRGRAGYPGKDAANPRDNNLFGHIIHWQEANGDVTSQDFEWDILALAGSDQTDDPNLKAQNSGDAFGSPDGLGFDHNGVLWVQTDVSSSTINQKDYAGMGNNQMLAVNPEDGHFKRFLTAPNRSEVTGIAFTPDNKTLFINIQHPGETDDGTTNHNTPIALSTWPDGPSAGRPRSATVVIQRLDGGVIGS